MSATVTATNGTVLDELIEYLRAKDIALDGQQRPAAILWTDPKAEWRSLVQVMQTRVEELLVLGDYAPEQRTGPSVWIRCLVDRVLDEPNLPGDRAPIVYLPGVARQDLRAGEECRDELKPLVELMFRGTLWLQHNGSDWGVRTFLTSTKALGLDIAGDQRTTDAMLRALPELAVTPVPQLAGHQLDADEFDRMLSDDVIRDLLRWMGDPEGTKARLGDNGWAAFCSRCTKEFEFDPSVDADITAGERMGGRQGPWAKLWVRFDEAPTSFPGIVDLLRRSKPAEALLFDREPWPDLNDEDESAVRKTLGELTSRAHADACAAVEQLEREHGQRRGWVWARMGLSPMAGVLEPLSRLATASRSAIGGNTPDEIAAAYRQRGWQGDAATWEAIAIADTADEELICSTVRHLALPWLEDSARAFQKTLGHAPLPGPREQVKVEAVENGCVLFCDGLRYDIGMRLAEQLEGRGCRVAVSEQWAATPTVTATAKPAVSPVADKIVGQALEKDFGVLVGKDHKPANASNLRKAIEDHGYQILGAGGLDLPMDSPARGWLECGAIDSLGHKLKGRLARHIGDEIDRLVQRILELLDSGWESIRVVTDHGWLLLPGGLPKADLPRHLTESRWARCAVIAGDSTPEVPRYPWYWNRSQYFASAPGIACFNRSEEYAHGGLSVQECLIPDLVVERASGTSTGASIDSITWRGMRCFVEATASDKVVADLRLSTPTGESVVASPKPFEDGRTSLVLSSDEYEEASLVLVLADEDGKLLAHRPTRVGEES